MSSKGTKKLIVKKSTADEDGRRRREQTLIKIRKEKREEGLQKRRNLITSILNETESTPSSASSDLPGSDGTANTNNYLPPLARNDIIIENLVKYCEGMYLYRYNE
jgi:hypothetical protein